MSTDLKESPHQKSGSPGKSTHSAYQVNGEEEWKYTYLLYSRGFEVEEVYFVMQYH